MTVFPLPGSETPEGFFSARRTWFQVRAVDRPGGGWDVMLRIDGTYFTKGPGDKERMVAYFEEWLNSIMEKMAP